MKTVVIGGNGLVGSRLGLIGSKLVTTLVADSHDVVSASPDTGVNSLIGDGLIEALDGAAVVIDVSHSPSFEETAAVAFLETSTRNILVAESAVGSGHHVALSIVGAERLGESGYIRAKVAQENLIRNSSIPYTIVQATRCFEFAASVIDGGSDDGTVRVPPVLIQPMAADDLADALRLITLATPRNSTVEIAGPDRLRFENFVREGLRAVGDQRVVVADPQARYLGARVSERTLLPDGGALLGPTHFCDWLSARTQGW